MSDHRPAPDSDRDAGALRRAARVLRLERARRAAPVGLLLLSLAVAGVGAYHAHRAQRSHRATAEALLRDYGSFAAWSFTRRGSEFVHTGIRDPLLPPRIALLTAESPDDCLREVLELARSAGDCACGPALGGDFAFLVRIAPSAGAGRFVGDAPDAAARRAVVDALVQHARTAYRPNWPHAVVHARAPDGAALPLAYVRLTGETGDTLVYGVALDTARLADRFGRAFEHQDLLPASLTHGVPNRELIAVAVDGPAGRRLFASHPGSSFRWAGDHELPGALGGGAVRAAVLPSAADRLIIGGLPQSRVPWLLLIFGLAGALALLAVSQLRRENQLARLRSDFVASVSHELRTPLAQIRLFIETLRLGRTRTEGEREWALANIDRETLRLAQLVENVLRFSRAERGLRSFDPERVPFANVADDVVASFSVLLRRGRATVRVDVDPALRVLADRGALEQLLLNLLDNAVKYGPAGQTVRLAARRRAHAVRITVEDEGPGVPANQRERVWEPFRRGRAVTGGSTAGSGIGLSVVRDIVDAHGGAARIEDSPGGGARVVVELPAAGAADAGDDAVDGPDADAAADGEGVGPQRARGAGERGSARREAGAA